MFWNKYPYSNLHDLNLDWIIAAMKELESEMSDLIKNAALKYADPFQWSITRQYESNTVVIDPESGIAYLSVQPVPANILITNTDYWTPVFDLSALISDMKKYIGSTESGIAENDILKDTLFFINDDLYISTADIAAGSAIIEGTNADKTDIASVILDIMESVSDLSSEIDVQIENARNGVGTVYAESIYTIEKRVTDYANFWGACVLNGYTYVYCSPSDISAAGKILKIRNSDGQIVNEVSIPLYWGNALCSDGVYIYALYGDTSTNAIVYRFTDDLVLMNSITLQMTAYAELMTFNTDLNKLEVIAVNRQTQSFYVYRMDSDLSNLSSEARYPSNIQSDFHDAFTFYNGYYYGITVSSPRQIIQINQNFEVIRYFPIFDRAINNLVGFGEVESLSIDNDYFYLTGQLSQTGNAFQDTTALTLFRFKINSAPAADNMLMLGTYYNHVPVEILVNIDSGFVNGDGTTAAPFKSPIAANSAAQYFSRFTNAQVIMNFTADQDLSSYILSLNGLRGVQVYLRGYTLQGIHMFDCDFVEFNGDFNLSGEHAITPNSYRSAQLDMFYCRNCQFNGTYTLTTGTNASNSIRCVHSYNNVIRSITMNKGITSDTVNALKFIDNGIADYYSTNNVHMLPMKTYTATDVKNLISQALADVFGKTGNYIVPFAYQGQFSGIIYAQAITATRVVGILIPQINNTGRMIYAFQYESGTVTAASYTGTAI